MVRVLDFNGQNIEHTSKEFVALLSAKFGGDGLLATEVFPGLPKAGEWAGNVETDRKGLIKALATAVFTNKPQLQMFVRVGIKV